MHAFLSQPRFLTPIFYVLFTIIHKFIHIIHQTPHDITALTTENGYLNRIIPFLYVLVYIK